MREWLFNRRTELTLSQVQVADKCGYTVQYYSMLETGSRGSNLSIFTLTILATALQVDLKWAFDEEVKYINNETERIKNNGSKNIL